MNNILAIFRKEFKSYFSSPIAYIYITVFIVLSSWLFFRGFFVINQADMRGYFGLMPWMFLFFVPAVTMKLWAEERKLGTDELLMTLPVREHEALIGKYLAGFMLFVVSIASTWIIPVVLFAVGNPDGGPIVGGYLGVLLMGAAYLAIGLFASTLTENQIVAFILGVVICFALLIIGEDFVLFSVPQWLVPICSYLGLGAHFASIGRGVLDSRDLIYYLSLVGFFRSMSVHMGEARKWS